MKKIIVAATLAGHIAFASPAVADVESYNFHVSCPTGSQVWRWHIGKVDPGRELLRVSTGTQNPGCSISSASAHDLAHLRVEDIRGAEAWVRGVPLGGTLLWKFGNWLFG